MTEPDPNCHWCEGTGSGCCRETEFTCHDYPIFKRCPACCG